MIQTNKQTSWTDDKGVSVPFTRITKIEREKEKIANKIVTDATAIKERLKAFKTYVETECGKLYQASLKEHKAEDKVRKGNFTWYNFDKEVRVEVNVNERIGFQEPEISIAKEKLDSFISDNLGGVDKLIQELVNDAFQNTKGALDAKKVMSLLKYRSKIKAVKFQEALDLIEKSIVTNGSKTYFKVSLRQPNGEYEYIDLNFSSL
jgi:hypothetical protein